MFSTLTPLSLRWVWGQLSHGSWIGTSWWWLVRVFGKLVHKALFQGGKALPGQGSSVCPSPYSCLKITTSLHRLSVRGDHHGRSPGDDGLGLRDPNKPLVLGKMQKSGSLQIYLWLSTCPALKKKTKNRKVPRADHFMQNQGALYVPIQADVGASFPVPVVVLSGE